MTTNKRTPRNDPFGYEVATEPDYPMSAIQPTDYSNGKGEPTKLFDVTCVIGSVYSGGEGDESPRNVAFRLIAEHTEHLQAPGFNEFSFPNEDGTITTVGVETTKPKAAK